MTGSDSPLIWIRWFCGFAGIGGLVTLLSMILIFAGNEWFGVPPLISYVTAYLVTLLLSYWLNAKFVFHSPFRIRGLALYLAAYLSGMGLGILMLRLLIRFLPGINETILSYAVIPVTMVWNFLFAARIMEWCRKGVKCYE